MTFSAVPTHRITALIEEQMKRDDLTAEDILALTLANRLNTCSDRTLAHALGGPDTPLNFWGKR